MKTENSQKLNKFNFKSCLVGHLLLRILKICQELFPPILPFLELESQSLTFRVSIPNMEPICCQSGGIQEPPIQCIWDLESTSFSETPTGNRCFRSEGRTFSSVTLRLRLYLFTSFLVTGFLLCPFMLEPTLKLFANFGATQSPFQFPSFHQETEP